MNGRTGQRDSLKHNAIADTVSWRKHKNTNMSTYLWSSICDKAQTFRSGTEGYVFSLALISFVFKQTLEQSDPRIYWTDFHQIFTIRQVFDRRLPSWLHFSDFSRDVAMTTNFRVKISKIGLSTFNRSPGNPNRIAISPFWFQTFI